MCANREVLRSLCALLLAFGAWTAEAELVTYQKGDGKGSVSETDDTTIDETVPDTTWVGNGQDVTHMEIDRMDHKHSLVKFPNIFGNGTDQIPLGSLILSATLTLELDNDGTDCPFVYQLVEDWTESEATWNSRSTGVSWSTPGADAPSHDGVLVGIMPCTGATKPPDSVSVNLDVTASVQNWSNGQLNAGWVFLNDANDNGINYRTSEHATVADRPMLTVNFLPEVFYSVGTNAGDLKTGSPTVTVASGVATLDVAQTNDIGVGDVIDHDFDNKRVYIWDVISPTEFRVQKGDGTAPDPVAGVTVNSITRAFNSVPAAVGGSAALLGNADLTAAGRRLTWICYNDGPFNVSSSTTITGFTTDATHFITLTVAGASQVVTGNSQRHRGTAGTGVRFEAVAGGIKFFIVDEPYTRLEWLELDGNDISAAEGIRLLGTADNSLVRNTIAHHLVGTPGSETQTASGIFIDPGNDASEVRNTIVYSFDGDGVHVSGTNAVVANSTFFEGRTDPSSNSVQTDTGGTASVYNVLAVGPEADFWENDAPGLSLYNCISEDNSAQTYDVSGNFKIGVDELTEFLSVVGTIDLHLRPGAEAADFGTDLSASFLGDIDDETRPFGASWDVGADESPVGSATINYRSIGNVAPIVDSGTINVTAGSSIVTKSGGVGWLSSNRGRGDVLRLPGPVDFMITAVVSDNELRLASLPTANYNAGIYTIDRQFDDMQSWYDCISNQGACTYFPVVSNDLVADDRIEIGIAFTDLPGLVNDVNFQDAVTDTTHTITLTADPGNRHNGIPGAGVVVDAQDLGHELQIRDSNITVEWLEFIRCRNDTFLSPVEVWGSDGPPVDIATNVLLQNLLIHNFAAGDNGASGIDLTGSNAVNGKRVTIRNVMIWDGDERGIEGDGPPTKSSSRTSASTT